jgi:hypothetical protein
VSANPDDIVRLHSELLSARSTVRDAGISFRSALADFRDAEKAYIDALSRWGKAFNTEVENS